MRKVGVSRVNGNRPTPEQGAPQGQARHKPQCAHVRSFGGRRAAAKL